MAEHHDFVTANITHFDKASDTYDSYPALQDLTKKYVTVSSRTWHAVMDCHASGKPRSFSQMDGLLMQSLRPY